MMYILSIYVILSYGMNNWLAHIHGPAAELLFLLLAMLLQVTGFSQFLELLDLLQKPLHFFVGLFCVRLLSLEEALPHKNGEYPWENE